MAYNGRNMPGLSDRYQKNPAFVARRVVDETILVPIRHALDELDSIYTLNETANLAWTLLDGAHTLSEICQRVTEEYEVDLEQAWTDLNELVLQLQEIGAVEKI